MMRSPFRTVSVLLLLVLGAISGGHAESVYPAGTSVSATYALSSTTLVAGDTLTVTRQMVNGGTYPLTGLYLSEHLPAQLAIVSAAVTINGSPVAVGDSTLPNGSVVAGCTSRYWILGTPSGGTSLASGSTLQLRIRIRCLSSGQFTLPLHAAAFFRNGNPGFATGAPLTVTVNPLADTTPPAAIRDLQAE